MRAAEYINVLQVILLVTTLSLLPGIRTTAYALIIDEPVLWSTSPPLIEEEIRIVEGGTLTINAGVTVTFGVLDSAIQGHISVNDGGTLTIAGTSVAPVTFNTTEQVNWARIIARTGSAITMDHALLRRGGQWGDAALVVETANADIRNVSIEDCIADGIRVVNTDNSAHFENLTITQSSGNAIYQTTADMSPTYAGALTFSGNLRDGIAVTANNAGTHSVSGTVHWDQIAVPFFLSGWLRVGDTGVFNIGPGVEIRFIETTSAKQSLIASTGGGAIHALGTSEAPIVFSSGLDAPAPGDWSEVSVWEGGSGEFAYCEFQYGGNFGTPSILIESSDVTVNHCTITNSEGDGIRLAGDGIAPALDGLIIQDCGGPAVHLETANMVPDIGNDLNFTNNAGGDVIFVTVSTDVDHVVNWPVAGTPYAISGWLQVVAGGVLNVGPGAEVQFAPTGSALQSNIDIEDGGTFAAMGTLLSRTLFTSFQEGPAPGDWAFLRFQQGATANMTYCDVEYAGQFGSSAVIVEANDATLDHVEVRDGADEGIELNGAGNSPMLASVTVRRSNGWGIRQATVNMDPRLENILLRDNAEGNAVFINAGTGGPPLSGILNLEYCEADYALAGWLRVAQSAALTVDPGVILRFAPSGVFQQSFIEFDRFAQLNAEGTHTERILFTSASPEPAIGDWHQLHFLNDSSGSLQYTTIEYANTANVKVETFNLSIGNSILRHAAQYGLHVSDGIPIGYRNDIHDNLIGGAVNTGPYTVDLINTWWGDASGPYHPVLNDDGLGNEISDGFAFDPWATAPNQIPCIAASPRSYRFAPQGGSESIVVVNSGAMGLNWTANVVSGSDWLEAAVSKGNEAGNIVVTAAPYSGDDQRAGVLRIAAPGAALEEVNIIIGQYGAQGIGADHAADQDGDKAISLSELLRVIQFFNSGGLHCGVETEDGYAPGPGDTACTPHASDYNAQDWEISLSELLRLIQFYNTGGYHPNIDGEDGFGPGVIL